MLVAAPARAHTHRQKSMDRGQRHRSARGQHRRRRRHCRRSGGHQRRARPHRRGGGAGQSG